MNVDTDPAAPRFALTAADSATMAGEWIMPPVSYVDPRRRFCVLCGRPIARRYWQVAMEGTNRVFCDPAHADLYTTYPKRTNSLEE